MRAIPRLGIILLLALAAAFLGARPQPAAAAEAVAVVAGYEHTCSLSTDGGLKCWGRNRAGELGAETTEACPSPCSTTPVDVVNLGGGVAALSAGYRHTCAVTEASPAGPSSGGGVKCWGWNDVGQLGDGTTIDRLEPANVSRLASGVTAVAAGAYHSCALTTEGGVECWGHNRYGQLGVGTIGGSRSTPVAVCASGAWNDETSACLVAGQPAPLTGAVGIAAGGHHTCVLTTAGGVQCWGKNETGQLGDGTTANRPTPVDVTGLGGPVTALTAGYSHNCAVTAAGGVKCWGRMHGRTIMTPSDVSGLTSDIVAVDAGPWHTCALTTAGGMKCWGNNAHGELGTGTSGDSRAAPADVVGLGSAAVAITIGSGHTCALTDAGDVKCWGDNSFGQLGDATTTGRTTPVDVAGLKPAPGDADCSGLVNSIDAALVLQSVAGLTASMPCPDGADANEDGATNAIDAALILQYNAGLIDGLPP